MSGIFGIVSKEEKCSFDLVMGTNYLSHLGASLGGVVTLDGDFQRQIHGLRNAKFLSKFEDELERLPGSMGLGVISADDAQPLIFDSKIGHFSICSNGNIQNLDELVEKLKNEGSRFRESRSGKHNKTEVLGELVSSGKNFVDGIEKAWDSIDGSASMLIMTDEGIYAARDRRGTSTLSLAANGNGSYIVSTETTPFSNLRYGLKKELRAGEIIHITQQGLESEKKGTDSHKICGFLWVYTSSPADTPDGILVEMARERCGAAIAKRDNIDVDYVTGIPDSGIAHAVGYAMASGKPYRRCMVKYTPGGFDRSYNPSVQKLRDYIGFYKIIVMEEMIKGKKIVALDDSLVRNTQLRRLMAKIGACRPKEMHVRPASPPLLFPCYYDISTRKRDELAAVRAISAIEGKYIEDLKDYLNPNSRKFRDMVEWIRFDLNKESDYPVVNTLMYQRMGDMVNAIGVPKERLCTFCWDGAK